VELATPSSMAVGQSGGVGAREAAWQRKPALLASRQRRTHSRETRASWAA
jgi:hypothetical protein